MKQIIKVESYAIMDSNGRWVEQTHHNCIELSNNIKIKQVSYQYFDFEKNEWVMLPNPQQPKIEGVYKYE